MKIQFHRQDAKFAKNSEQKKSCGSGRIGNIYLIFSSGFLGGLGVLAVISLNVSVCFAQTTTGAAAGAVPLLNLQGSARDLGMGSAFVAVADDGSALFYNSSGLSGIRQPEVSLHHNSYLAGTFQETLSAAFPGGPKGGLALALSYINWGSLDLRDSSGVSQGSFNDTDIGLTAAWGLEWTRGFSSGIAVRVVQQKVVNDLYTSLAGDLGVLWSPVKNFRLGAAYSNLGTPVSGHSLTGQFQGGASANFNLSSRDWFLLALSGSWFSTQLGAAQAGGELVLDKRWSLRAGYQLPFTDNQVSGFTNFTAGAGVKIDSWSLDYAYLPFGSLGTSHRVSLSYQFELPKEVVRVQVPVTVLQPVPEAPNPKDVEVHFKISNDPLAEGQGLEKEGKWNEALRVYAEALKETPRNDLLWSAMGRLYYQFGKKEYATRCFENALKIKPDNTSLRVWLEKYKAFNPSK